MASKPITTPGAAPAVTTSARPKGRSTRQINLADVEIIPAVPPAPPSTPEEQADFVECIRLIENIRANLRTANLQKAVLLAQQAATGRGPLVEHFAELGRRFGDDLFKQPCAGQRLRVIDGGAA